MIGFAQREVAESAIYPLEMGFMPMLDSARRRKTRRRRKSRSTDPITRSTSSKTVGSIVNPVTSSPDAALVSSLLTRIDAMERHWQPDPATVRDLETLIERLRSDDAVCTRLSALLHDSLANPHAHTVGMMRGLLLAVHAYRPASVESDRYSGAIEPGLTAQERQRVLDHIHAHLDTGMSVAELAAASGVAPAQFSRALKRTTGLSVRRWLLLQRVERVKHLLALGELKLDQIAIACGFSSQSHLNKAFVQLAGTTPRNWRLLRCGSARPRTPNRKN